MSPVTDQNRKVLLASGSPRRRQLLARLGFEPVVRVSRVPEERGADETPRAYTERLALAKAGAVAAEIDAAETDDASLPDWILAADTIVVDAQDHVLEKPADAGEATRMLERLSGAAHEVLTSFCWLNRQSGARTVQTVAATVFFRALDAETIARYVATAEPYDKAGGYGIQDLAGAFVPRIEGSYYAIVGLPVCEVVAALERLGGLAGFPFRDATATEAS